MYSSTVMKALAWVTLSLLLLFFSVPTHAEDASGKVKKAIERVTLDQPGANRSI